MSGIYVHIPFCQRKCIYCDFYSVGARLADWPGYVDALLAELRARVAELPASADTLYIGGGTPSLMPAPEFRRLASELCRYVKPDAEFTVEVNPDDVTHDRARMWREAGVNRVSMGVQTLDDNLLRFIGRRHTARQALDAYALLRPVFDNISLDLIFGLPGQTRESLAQTLQQFIDLRPEHISAYSLMYEERTALTRMRDSGRISEADDVDSESMFRMISSRLAEAGYEQYEISNYSLPGRRSRHNASYWSGEPYIGLGPGAHSYDGLRTRRANLPDWKRYTEYWLSQSPSPVSDLPSPVLTEELSEEELVEEFIMTRLRTHEGIDLAEFETRFGVHALKTLMAKAAPEISRGNLRHADSRLMLTGDALLISDQVIVELI